MHGNHVGDGGHVPRVMVPVLSSTMVVELVHCLQCLAPLDKMPIWAPRPVPTMIAVGVASPSAQGQAMISTETKVIRANVNRVSTGARSNHTTKVAMATK